MISFIVERDVSDIDMTGLYQIAAAMHRHANRKRGEGRKIYYLGMTFLAADRLSQCLFEAEGASVVEEVNSEAGAAFTRILRVHMLAQPPVLAL